MYLCSVNVWSPNIFIFDSVTILKFLFYSLYSPLCIPCDVLYALNCNNYINYCCVIILLYPVLYIYSSYILHIVFAALYRMLSLLWILNMHFNVCINFYVLYFKYCIFMHCIRCILLYASYCKIVDPMHCRLCIIF